MAVHLTKIYTRTGDDGTTGLSDFSRVSKNDPRLVAYADCDELNAALGVVLALSEVPDTVGACLRRIQNELSTPALTWQPPSPRIPNTRPYALSNPI